MDFSERFKSDLINLTPSGFESFALDLFSFQFQHNRVYNTYCSIRGKSPLNVTNLTDIPFLPIELYKNHTIKTGDWKEEKWFLSSGTTGSQRSKLPIRDLHFYETISKHIFENKYGKLQNIQILGLLPSYQEQGHSSLIHMVDSFMKNARNGSGYFLDGSQALIDRLESPDGKKLLVGVSYALLDFTEDKNCLPVDTFVMETGGMKGRRKEMVREELHLQLTQALGVPSIHSEYGMTELTSQAYASQVGQFSFPVWAQALIRDINDPFSYVEPNRTGGINIIDLANVDTCAFIETKDLGRSAQDGHFEVLGRFDNSDVRGCNLLI